MGCWRWNKKIKLKEKGKDVNLDWWLMKEMVSYWFDFGDEEWALEESLAVGKFSSHWWMKKDKILGRKMDMEGGKEIICDEKKE